MIKEKLWKTLETLGHEVYQQGSFTDTSEYPDNFFTIWNDETEETKHYDNKARCYIWYFTVNFYSTNPFSTEMELLKAITLLEMKGWIAEGKGEDTYSGTNTHSGRSVRVKYIEREK